MSIEARISALADAIEAMMSDRPYRKARNHQEIIEELDRYCGTQFDPLVVVEATRMLSAAIASDDRLSNPANLEKVTPQLRISIQTS